ncbi:anhydro-N-acetylmuramic acid kinase [Burkholderiaceae bacterium DAT-1]|nr:anhydro-N-acetylmuramic acid kinase [Burkholderiaceae bacterium DAT-1]
MPNSTLYIGLMSGTSMDGIDCVLIDLARGRPDLLAQVLHPFDPALKSELMSLQSSSGSELHRASLAANNLAMGYASAVREVCRLANVHPRQVAAIGMHGQTIRHRPELGYTLQIGNAALLAELSAITVVSDFRSRDIAAGGQGAPLVPAFHASLFASEQHRVILNIGGIANVTDLPTSGQIRGWDTGPGNLLMDGWISRHQGKSFDERGEWAAKGCVHKTLLDLLLKEAFFDAPPPKSTGRDLFHMRWLDEKLARCPAFSSADIQATLLEFTARSISASIEREARLAEEIYVCGGGAHNTRLMNRLTELNPLCSVGTTDALGLHPDWVEACAFAWLAHERLHNKPGNLPAVTGARGLRILGAVHAA